jgi:hypothetical protein
VRSINFSKLFLSAKSHNTKAVSFEKEIILLRDATARVTG